ncbi:hypothetical protein FACS189421_08230 [Bacteroidia bacterium]|nr:hypothetical protein FACS189421_08230 [Bacteroidia bacterium]
MNTKAKNPIRTTNYLSKIVEDKKAIHNCIRTKGNLLQLALSREIKFAIPI